jgi:hypothetical protein
MRLRPAVGLNMSCLIPPHGAQIHGVGLPAGISVAVNGWVLHRDQEVFGKDADEFRPTRWLEDLQNAKRMEWYMFQFGGGSHPCIGRNLCRSSSRDEHSYPVSCVITYTFTLKDSTQLLTATATFFVVQTGLETYIKSTTRA